MSSIDQINQNLANLEFTNTSAASIVEEIAVAVGLFDDVLLAEMANSQAIINNLQQSQWGYLEANYYITQALQFQVGYNLVLNEAINPVTGEPFLNYIYSTIDPTAQIVKQAAFQASPSGGSTALFLKIAGLAVSGGELAPLTSDQLAAFQNYMLTFEGLGLPLNIISLPANILDFTSVATVLSSFDLPTLQTNLTAALIAFQTSFQYNGEFYNGDLCQYIQQNVPGMRNFFISNTTLDGAAFTDYSNLQSGYFNYAADVFTNITFNSVTS